MPIAVILHLIFAIFAYTSNDIFPKNITLEVDKSLNNLNLGLDSMIANSTSFPLLTLDITQNRLMQIPFLLYMLAIFLIIYIISLIMNLVVKVTAS